MFVFTSRKNNVLIIRLLVNRSEAMYIIKINAINAMVNLKKQTSTNIIQKILNLFQLFLYGANKNDDKRTQLTVKMAAQKHTRTAADAVL